MIFNYPVVVAILDERSRVMIQPKKVRRSEIQLLLVVGHSQERPFRNSRQNRRRIITCSVNRVRPETQLVVHPSLTRVRVRLRVGIRLVPVCVHRDADSTALARSKFGIVDVIRFHVR